MRIVYLRGLAEYGLETMIAARRPSTIRGEETVIKRAYMTTANSRRKSRLWIGQAERHRTRRKRFRFDVRSSALLVLDMQGFFLNSDSHAYVPSSKAIIPNVRALVGFFRERRRPLIFTRHALSARDDPGIMERWWRDVVEEGSPWSAIIASLKPAASEPTLRKARYSAFVGTDLERILGERNVESVVVTGVTTHLCCDTTARDAFMKDFEVYFVVDATATWSEDLHVASLKTLADGFVMLVTTEEILGSGADE